MIALVMVAYSASTSRAFRDFSFASSYAAVVPGRAAWEGTPLDRSLIKGV